MIKVFLVSTFLGHVNRGHEAFTRQCFDVLSKETSIDTILFKGGESSHGKEIALRSPLFNGSQTADKLTKSVAKLMRVKQNYLQQVLFFFSLLPYIAREQPDIIYLSEIKVTNLLGRWKRLSKQKYKILLSNGGPTPPPFPLADYVQQIASTHLKKAIEAGVPDEIQSLLPQGFYIEPTLQLLTPSEREALRDQLGLPAKRPIVISVGAIKARKRMDYVIREVAGIPEPRPYLVLLGQPEEETDNVIELGNKLLGAEHFLLKTVLSKEVMNYYKVADAFVLASLSEGLARVFVEALSQGLPCLVHDYEVTRFALGDEGYFADFNLSGSLTALISKVLAEGQDYSKCHSRHQSAYERFSWDKLSPKYVEMFQHVAQL